MTRAVRHHYDDPLDLIWRRCAAELGYAITRSPEVYASFDGDRVIALSTPDDFDADDSLAQMIFHELCHALVAAPDGLKREDWGLDNTTDRDLVQEHATHRLQAHLADRWGLRALFAVTTVWRDHWDRLPRDPLAGDDPAAALAREARARADREPWAGALRRAFARTAELADHARAAAAALDGDHDTAPAPTERLWMKVSTRVHERHPLGPRLGPVGERCGTCAWGATGRCHMLRVGTGAPPKVRPEMVACLHFEPRLSDDTCADCGACCHKAFHLVPVGADEPLVAARPELVQKDAAPGLGAGAFWVDRPGGFCRALEAPRAPFRCGVYALRPQSCRDFALGGENCLEARRRVGLSVRP